MNKRFNNLVIVFIVVVLVVCFMLVGLGVEYLRYKIFLDAFPGTKFSFIEWLFLFGRR